MKKLLTTLLLATAILTSCGKDSPAPCPMVLEKKAEQIGGSSNFEYYIRYENQTGGDSDATYFANVSQEEYNAASVGNRYCKSFD